MAKFYSRAADLIEDGDIDAIYIATPPDSHKHYALKVAAAGKICCIEKPMAPHHGDCVAICQAFASRDLPLFVAYYRRSLPRFKQVKTWIEEGAIGEVRHVRWHLSKAASGVDLSGAYNWRTDPEIAPGGYFDDLASHGLDLFIHLLGDVKTAWGIGHNQQALYASKDAVVGCWLHESGVTGSGSWHFGCSQSEDRVDLLGSKGRIEFSVFGEVPLRLSNPSGIVEQFIENPENIQLYHVENMREHLLGNGNHPSTGQTATHTAWVMDRILGKPETVSGL